MQFGKSAENFSGQKSVFFPLKSCKYYKFINFFKNKLIPSNGLFGHVEYSFEKLPELFPQRLKMFRSESEKPLKLYSSLNRNVFPEFSSDV